MKNLQKDFQKVIDEVLEFEIHHKKELVAEEWFNLNEIEYHMFMLNNLLKERK